MRSKTLALLLFFAVFASGATTVRTDSHPHTYAFQLLKLALTLGAEDEVFDVEESSLADITLERRIRMLQQGDFVDVMALAVTAQRMNELLAIQQPIRFGMQGLRILLVTEGNLERFGQIESLEQLQKLQAGFVYGWADMQVLQANALPAHYAAKKENVYSMLSQERVDYFPRSVSEVMLNYREHVQHHPNLKVEPSIALYYPLPVYFFVGPDNQSLAAIIEKGLIKAKQNGTMEALFLSQYGENIRQLNLDERKIVELLNPALPSNITLPELHYTQIEP